jgi:ACS family tartrate transporter-like MFS transporter
MTSTQKSGERREERGASGTTGVPLSSLTSPLSSVSRRLLPFLFLLFGIGFLDRINISFAALTMNRDLGFSASVYGFGAGVFFFGYVLFAVPANAFLVRFGVRRWVGGMMVAWGVISGCTALIQRPVEFYLLRALLGFAEAGFFPAMIFYLTRWYPLAERARAVATCMIAVPMAGVVGGPLSGLILGMNGIGGVAGWRWLFVLEALPALILGLLTWLRLPERPAEARWLTAAERSWLEEAMAGDAAPPTESPATGRFPMVLLLMAIIWFGVVLVGYGWLLWLPQVLAARSHGAALSVGLLSAVPQLVGVAGALWFARWSDQHGDRRRPVVLATVTVAIGLTILATTESLPLTVGAFSLMAAGQCGLWGPFWTLPGEYLRGPALATGVAIITSVGNVGGFVGPLLVGVLLDRTAGFSQGLLVLAAIQGVAVVLALGLWRTRQGSLVIGH